MADTKITALTALTGADPANDVIPIVDVSDTTMAASGTTKKISVNNILGASGTATLASATITGDLTVDTNTLKVDSVNNRVGIGTASPQQTFEVVGGTAGINTIFNTGSAGDSRFELRNNNVRSGYVYWDTSEVRLFADTSRALTFYQNGTLGMTLNSTGLGVGVASPVEKVDVAGNVKSNAWIGRTNISAPTADCAIYRPADNTFAISTANTERFRVDISGNVGIGVTPSYKLHVNGRVSYSTGIGEGADLTLSSTGTQVQHGISSTWTSQNFYTGGTSRVVMKQNGQVRFVPLASDPAGAEAGDVYYNSTSNKLKCYNGTTWNDLF